MEPARHVGAGDDGEQGIVVTEGLPAETFADVVVQVDDHLPRLLTRASRKRAVSRKDHRSKGWGQVFGWVVVDVVVVDVVVVGRARLG